MILLRVLELMLILLTATIFVTQIFIPMFRGTKLFPLLRPSKLQEEAQDLRDEALDLGEKVEQTAEVIAARKQIAALQLELDKLLGTKPKGESNERK